MRINPALAAMLSLLSGCGGPEPDQYLPPVGPSGPVPESAPNILLILVDDLGYADLGVTGSEIRTPNIDALANEGVLLTDFHVTPVCFATRAALMTGVDHHTAGLGGPAVSRTDDQKQSPAYAGRLSPRVRTLAELFRDRGYHTYMAGKWDLGSDPESRPHRRGFERSWALMEGGASHFSDAAGLVIFQRGGHYYDDGRAVEPPEDFYSSIFYTDQVIRYLEEQPDDGRPFFAYAAYTAPHWPLQVPDEWLDRYAGAYDAGYDQLLRDRMERMKAIGLIPPDAELPPRPPQIGRWDELDADQQRAEARRMELYAAMVELLDQEIGRLLDWIGRSRFADNTMVVFLSDNGPEGNDIGKLPLNALWIPLAFDNSPENLGRENSYVWYGAGWANAGSGPLRWYKAYPSEGGYRVPAVVSWPGQVEGGRTDDAVLTLTDLSATLLDYGGVAHPGASGSDIEPLQGRSFRARLEDPAAPGPNAGRTLPFELFGRMAVRRDNWKALHLLPPFGTGDWELFDLGKDLAERHDLSAEQPELLAELVAEWQAYADAVGVVLPEGGEFAYGVPDIPDSD